MNFACYLNIIIIIPDSNKHGFVLAGFVHWEAFLNKKFYPLQPLPSYLVDDKMGTKNECNNTRMDAAAYVYNTCVSLSLHTFPVHSICTPQVHLVKHQEMDNQH